MADTGHVRKRGKSWTYVYSVPDPITGKRRQIWRGGYSTKKQARQALRQALVALEKGTWISPTKLTLSTFVKATWLPLLETQLEESTIESYERNMRLHVLPVLGDVCLQDLGAQHLNTLYSQLLSKEPSAGIKPNHGRNPAVYDRIDALRAEGLSYQKISDRISAEFPTEAGITRHAVARIIARSKRQPTNHRKPPAIRTVRYIHTIIRRCLADALKLDLVTKNVAINASPPATSKAKPKKKLWTAEQTKHFLTWCKEQDRRLFPAWAFVASSGDRRGANLGLRWRDINFATGHTTLTWTVTCVNHTIVVKPYGKAG